MNNRILEALGILQEECAEVIQMISKCRRFGIDSMHVKAGRGNRAELTTEIGDMLALVDFLVDNNVLSIEDLNLAKQAKIEKLKSWSTIYK